MRELSLLGPDKDGSNLTFNDEEGNRYLLPINDELLTALSQTEVLSKIESLKQHRNTPTHTNNTAFTSSSADINVISANNSLRPREIQALLRAGVSAEQVAQESGISLKKIHIYESPILAERDYICTQAQKLSIGADASLNLLDITLDRLATRNIRPEDVSWDAIRPFDEPWQVIVSFPVGNTTHHASWKIDIDKGLITALDDEARWITETDMRSEKGRGLLDMTDENSTRLDARRSSNPTDNNDFAQTEAILRDLNEHRGKKQPVVIPLELDDETENKDISDEQTFGTLFTFDSLQPEEKETKDIVENNYTDENNVFSLPNRHSILPTNSNGISTDTDQTNQINDYHVATDISDKTPANHTVKTDSLENTPSLDECTDDNSDKKDTTKHEDKKSIKHKKPQRRSVPSWDEIVFGTKKD